ncbi:hypothetical protein Tco_1506817 [Tanacetum coccineum]
MLAPRSARAKLSSQLSNSENRKRIRKSIPRKSTESFVTISGKLEQSRYWWAPPQETLTLPKPAFNRAGAGTVDVCLSEK